jgi:hypothetical protein
MPATSKSGVAFHFPPQSKIVDWTSVALSEFVSVGD